MSEEMRKKPQARTVNLITDVLTRMAAVPDVKATAPIQDALAARGLSLAGHYLDSGSPSAIPVTRDL
ncbi:hypothetical protein OG985_44685 [Streptomyces sp. NBC_00289]|uniref:hypothetical protein n=1 Tax=Streptomyces sp. NBC_00289 TaxID=2975703 RepID=UPI0032490872